MNDGNAAACVVAYDAPDVEIESKGRKTILRLKAMPWVRIVVDALLIAGILLASSSLLTVK
jgi:hypothetical protein